ncbi:hypothetical protein Tco_1434839 [Tanacetum coccineum]
MYEKIRKIPEELGIKSALPAPAPEQASFQSSRKKRKHMELEPEIKIHRLECNRALPEHVSFVNNMVIKEPEHRIFFTDEFSDQAFQRWSDIDKFGMEALELHVQAPSLVKFLSCGLENSVHFCDSGLPSTLDEGTSKTATHPQDLGGNKQPLDRDTTSTTPNEGTAKTTSRPEGSLGDKDSGGNIPPADMEPIHTPVVDPSRTAFLLSDDELDKESDEEEMLAAGDDMDEDPRDDAEVRTPSPGLTQPDPSHYLKKVSRVLFNRITKKQWEQHEEAAVSYADLKASIDQYYDENITHRDHTNKLVEASISSLDRSSTAISDLYKGLNGLNVITELLKNINTAVKDDPATNQKINEATETFTRISSNITETLSFVKGFDFFALLSAVKSLRDHAFKQEEASTA